MDDIGVDPEDINEYESLLYAQVHHEVGGESIRKLHNMQNLSTGNQIVAAASVINRPSCSRYWCKNLEQRHPNSRQGTCTGEFGAPQSSFAPNLAAETGPKQNNQRYNYRVDQMQFRALAVAETAFTKDGSKTRAVVLAADSSSEEIDNIEKTPIRSISKNPNSNVNDSKRRNSECGNKDAGGTASIGAPYIMRSEAIPMKDKIRNRRSHLTTLSRISPTCETSSGHMPDMEFIETLKNLSHGHREKETFAVTINAQQTEVDEDERKFKSDVANVQSVLMVDCNNPKHEEAIPANAISGLDKVFEFIDNFPAFQTTSSHSNSSNDIEIISVPITKNAVERACTYSPKYYTIHSKEHSYNSGFGWNEEMDKFYNSSWKGEHFSLADIQRGMDRHKKLWRISAEDRFSNLQRNSNLKCKNCCEFSHECAECNRPKKPPVCYMCGETGHFKESCPNTICLRCGNKTAAFIKGCESCSFQDRLICPICKVRGHSIKLCPDKWRRYHYTTTMNCYPNNSTKPNLREICCVCGRMCQYPEPCRKSLMDCPILVNKAKLQEKSHSDLARLQTRKVIPFNLLYNPKDRVQFHLAKYTKPTDCYGRFLNAVGMQSLLKPYRVNDHTENIQRLLKGSKNTAKSKELVSSNTVISVSEQVKESTENYNMNCTVAAPAKNTSVKDTVVGDCLAKLSFQNHAQNSASGTSPKSSAVGNGRRSGNIGNSSEAPSLFWSQQSLHYLEECIKFSQSGSERLSKLRYIQSKSRRGALSYNDYRAVVRIYGSLVRRQLALTKQI